MISIGDKRETKSKGCKANSERRQQWHYLAVKNLSALLRASASKHSYFYCLNCFYSLTTGKRLQSHKRVFENKVFCNTIMLSEDTKILQVNQDKKSDKAPFIIFVDLECTIEKIDTCKNNPENSSTTKISEHIPPGFSMTIVSSSESIEDKLDVYRGKDLTEYKFKDGSIECKCLYCNKNYQRKFDEKLRERI